MFMYRYIYLYMSMVGFESTNHFGAIKHMQLYCHLSPRHFSVNNAANHIPAAFCRCSVAPHMSRNPKLLRLDIVNRISRVTRELRLMSFCNTFGTSFPIPKPMYGGWSRRTYSGWSRPHPLRRCVLVVLRCAVRCRVMMCRAPWCADLLRRTRVCMCIYIYIYICKFMYVRMCLCRMSICTHACMYACSACLRVCVYVCIYAFVHVCVHACVHVCMYA